MANIQNELNNIKNATFGKEVRGSIHDGIDAINKEVESTTGRQVDLESTFDQLVINAGNSNAEIVDARVKADGTSYSKLGDRLDSVDSQLEHKVNSTDVFLKTNGININDFDEETRQTFLDAQGIDVNYVLGVENVKPINTTFINITANNLYDARNFDYNGYYQGGVFKSELSDYGSTGFIEVSYEKDDDYFYHFNGGTVSLFNESKTYIQDAVVNAGYFQITSDTKYVNIALKKDRRYNFYLLKNTNKLIEDMFINDGINLKEENISYSENTNKVFKYVNNLITNKISLDDIQFAYKHTTNIYDKNEFVPGKFYINSNLSSYENYGMTGFIPVKPNTTYKILDQNVTVGYTTAWNSNKEYIKNITPSKTINTPDDCYFLNIAIQDTYKDSFVIVEDGQDYENYYILQNIKVKSEDVIQDLRFKNKKANFLGDSITYGYGNVTPYHQYLKEMNGLSVVRNYGISGSRIATTSDRTDEMSKRFVNMDDDADLICVYGGINDFYGNVQIGTNNDMTTNTFKGALNVLYNGLIEKYPKATIFAVTPMKISNLWNGARIHLKEYRDAIIEIADLYSIPVLDLYSCSNISVKNETQLNYFTQDGLHPNELGHKERLAPKFSSFIETL